MATELAKPAEAWLPMAVAFAPLAEAASPTARARTPDALARWPKAWARSPVADERHVDHQRLFHTPHGLDLGLAAPLAGATLDRVGDSAGLDLALATSIGHPGVHLVHVAVDASTNVGLHRAATSAVVDALDRVRP